MQLITYSAINRMVLIIILLISISFISHDVIAAEGKNGNISQKQNNNKPVTIAKNDNNPTLDLKWLINEAVEHNPEINAVFNRLNAAKAKISQAKSLDDPTISAGSFDMSNNPYNINGQTDMLQQRYGISQKIPFPGKLRLKKEVASEEHGMVENELQSKTQEIIALVKYTFYELFYINRSIEITEENRNLLRKFTKIAETKYSVGKITQRDVLAAQVEVSTLTNNIIILKKEKESVIAMLNTLIDIPTQSPLGDPKSFEKHTLNLTLENLENLATKNRPELKKFDHAIKRSEANLKLSKKDYYYTDLEPMIEYMQEDTRPDTWSTSISINIPWLWPKNRAKITESKEDLNATKADYRFINNKTSFEIKDLLVKIQSSDSTINLYKTGVIPQAEQSLKAARIGYEADKVDFLTLIDSQRMLLNSKLLYYRALTDFEQNIANLERAVGIQITR